MKRMRYLPPVNSSVGQTTLFHTEKKHQKAVFRVITTIPLKGEKSPQENMRKSVIQ